MSQNENGSQMVKLKCTNMRRIPTNEGMDIVGFDIETTDGKKVGGAITIPIPHDMKFPAIKTIRIFFDEETTTQ